MNAQQLKNAILQEAIQGRLVPQDPNDEPASVLLDKIRKEKQQLVKEGKLKKKDLEETPIQEDEKPFEIPDSWEWCRIRDIFIINPKVSGNDEDDVAFIPMEKIVACYGSKYTYDIRKWKDVKSSFTSFADGDVAFAKITPCFQNRKSMILQNLPNGIGAGTTELKVLRQYSETIDRKYLLYFLASSYFVEEASFKGTANQQRIVVGYLENKLFPLPPLAEQHRIVEKIEELLPKVEKYGKAQEKLNKLNEELPERLKKSVLQEAISGRLVPQDPNDEPASTLLAKIREEKKQLVKAGKLKKKDLEEKPISEDEIPFEIPESWEWVRLKSFVQFINGDRGKNYPSKDKLSTEGEIPFISAANINENDIPKNELLYLSQKQYDALSQGKLKKNDVVLCIRGSLGKTAIYPYEKGAIASSLVILRNIGNSYNNYVLWFLKTPLFYCQINNNDNGTAQPNLSADNVANFLVPLPPLAEQRRIVAKIEQLFNEIDKLKK